jgi:hypothetical protein
MCINISSRDEIEYKPTQNCKYSILYSQLIRGFEWVCTPFRGVLHFVTAGYVYKHTYIYGISNDDNEEVRKVQGDICAVSVYIIIYGICMRMQTYTQNIYICIYIYMYIYIYIYLILIFKYLYIYLHVIHLHIHKICIFYEHRYLCLSRVFSRGPPRVFKKGSSRLDMYD